VESPFVVTLYDHAFNRRGWLGDYEQLTVTARHNAVSTASITLRADHHRAPALMEDGARVVIEYDGQQLMSGPAWASQGSLPTGRSSITFTVEDDLRIFGNVLGWPVPGAAIAAQSAADHDTRTGPAETVVKAFMQANAVTRLGLPLSVAASAGRGATVTVRSRMDNLRDLLMPVATAAGIGVTIRQTAGALLLDCYTPTVRSRVLTEQSGVLASGQWTRTGPSATDVIVGGQGEGTARVFRRVVDNTLAASWGTRVEVFRDANDATTTAELDARGAQSLSEGAPGAGVAIELAETATFRYGRSLVVGDVVPVELAPGITVTDVVTAVTLTHSRDTGVEVVPRVGADSASADPNAVLARALARVAAAVRRINTGR
jgi:hypothetical protein